jgi:hypothetical protein
VNNILTDDAISALNISIGAACRQNVTIQPKTLNIIAGALFFKKQPKWVFPAKTPNCIE